jgi:NitT/TauT family transport system substrate-binding protein
LGQSHQEWQLNEILGLIFPATNGIGVMNEELWDQTITIANEQVVELQGVEIPSEVFRTDLAQAAVDALGDADVNGEGYERREIELQEGGS